jgi:Tfp pilus assembly protein PilO
MTRTRKWSMLAAAMAVLVLLAGWFLLVSPKRASADDLRVQAAAQTTKNDGLKVQIAELQALQKDLPKQQAIIADVQQRIPQNPDLPALIRSLSSMATSAGVDIHSFSPVAPVASPSQAPANAVGLNGQTLQVINVSMEVDGTYYNVERFFLKMESLKRALLVNGLSLNVNAGTTVAGATTTQAQAGTSPKLAAIVTFRAFMVSSATAPGSSPLHVTPPVTGTSSTPATSSTSSTPAQ